MFLSTLGSSFAGQRPTPPAKHGETTYINTTGTRKTHSLHESIKARVGSFFKSNSGEKKRQAERHRSEPSLQDKVPATLLNQRASAPAALNVEEINPDSNLIRLIQEAITCPVHKETLLSLRGEPAADTILLMQKILDNPSEYGLEPHRHRLRRLLIRLSRESRLLPASLFLNGIMCKDRDAFGGGAFADIYQARYGKKTVALKRLRVFQISTNEQKTELISNFYREALMWRQLNHPYILPFLGVDRITFPGHLCMVSPFMSNGNIIQCAQYFLQIQADIPREPWLLEIAKGLAYLHEEQLVHGDLRGANILIDEDLHVRLADFGVAVLADSSTSSGISTRSGGAARWCSAEVLRGEPSSFESDIYAFGCVCVELYTLLHPFPDLNDVQVVARILEGVRPKRPGSEVGMQTYVWSVARRCWSPKPRRPTIAAVIDALASQRIVPSIPQRRSLPSSPRRAAHLTHRATQSSASNPNLAELADLAAMSPAPFPFRTTSPVSLAFNSDSSVDHISLSSGAVAYIPEHFRTPQLSPDVYFSDSSSGYELISCGSLESDEATPFSVVAL